MPRTPLALACAAMLAPLAEVDAQDADRERRARDSTARDSIQPLRRVTVVGSRTRTRAIDLPFAVSIVGREQFAARRGLGLEDALGTVPGVLAQSRSGSSDLRITIRGFGARGAGDRSNAGTTRGIRILTDGFPETEPDGRTSLDLIDLAAVDRVDVARSNASSVWGNAGGGVVHLSTRPDFERDVAEAQQMAGSFGFQRSILRAGTTLGDSARLHGTVASTGYDGWRVGSDSRRVLALVGLDAPLGARTTLGVQAVGSNNLFHIPGPLSRVQFDADPRQANATYRARDERRYNRLGRIGAVLEHRPNERNAVSGMLFANPKYLQRSERGTFRDFTRYHVGGNLAWRNSARFGEHARGTLTAGIDEAYQDGAILFYNLSPANARGDTLRDNKREGANNFGAYVQEELDLGRASVTLGLRYDQIKYHSQSYITPSLNSVKAFTGLTPKLGVGYELGVDHVVYASLGGGVEAPAGNETDPAGTFGDDRIHAINPLLDPIRSSTYELGTKRVLSFGSGPLRDVSYDVAGYLIEVRNEIVPYRGGRFYFTAGRARRTGLEVGTTLRAQGGVSLTSALTWSRNVYRSYRVDSVHYDPKRAGRFADYSGNAMVGVPDLFFGSTLAATPAAWRGVGIELSAQGTSRYFADDANRVTVPGYAVVNAVLSLRAPLVLGGVGVRGFVGVNNIFDRTYAGSAFLNPDIVGGAPLAFEPGLPRNYIVSVSVARVR